MSAAEEVYDALLGRVGEANPRPRIEPVRRLAELAGSPQLSFPVVQIAGTNGKTSTSRAVESLLRAHGLRTGLFTSPHLVDFTERFQVDGSPIGGERLAEAWGELQLPLEVVDAELEAAGQGPITFFEALAVLAFTAFADAPVDVAVIEVGMGGEWDATNIVDAQVAVFTPIALDHTAILGPDIATIAQTKAGIIKPGSTVVSAAQDPAALTAIEAAAERTGSRVLVQGRDFRLADDRLAVGGRQIDVVGATGNAYDPAFVPLFGGHQAENVALAIAAVEAFLGGERPVPEEVLDEGLGQLTSPGRLQLIGTDPSVVVDAAHNPHGAEALARGFVESFRFSEVALVVGVLGEKDAAGVLAALAPLASRVILTTVDSPRAIDADRLAELAATALPGLPVEVEERLPDALDAARAWASTVEEGETRGVLVTGSVMLAGEAIAYSRDEGWGIA
ncbi:dihydrofolate synthase [Leucobacter sp. OLJS4]|uniref:bifunctional folylpolyglutamate synthase/dihydrofolate synthase n=1 Tax=unclassified Leucobacter TaxID=2621730 RepID=UPI000C1860E6|nr:MULTISPECIES: folylpolyglutamate synthase/dihydrofolate synthase family protein [unclassified Leucobacter]PII81501.1 dihydrofolate synthase [Leucobacter sp. OLCALW19]PII86171.1 dihydrofolate synthase [Leucobacter sp. OLTLW20]PII90066.1 dihydrofolate synthase [Leucobacter sp. OLAS13]PII97099.1 dihydrofolate synthase [Leucobacter sp. OLDS2]PIJ02207.1 dihydrofolate synthase [Leucobacter sp. OLIS6]